MADYDDIRREVVAAMSAHDPGNLVREALERINRDAKVRPRRNTESKEAA